METWLPDLAEKTGPRYRAIAEAISDDIERGRLPTGARLPTHRDLARRLGVTVGTVSRAYAEAERRGLVQGEVGRGTFVSGSQEPGASFYDSRGETDLLDLGMSLPVVGAIPEERQLLQEAFASLARRADLPALAGCQPPAGSPRHRHAGATCVAHLGVETTDERVLVTCGGQHAMAATLGTVARPGDVVLTEELTFPGMKGLANLLHLNLVGLPMDDEGLRADAFQRACREGSVRVLYTIPTLQNPTSTVMSQARREELVAIAREHGVTILEDDVYGFLAEDRPDPLVMLAPEITYYFTSASKVLAPGFRLGFLVAPEDMVDRVAASVWATTGMAPLPMAEVVASWVESGDLERFIGWRREAARERNALAQEILPADRMRGYPSSFHVWLQLPEPWRSEDFVMQARRRGVVISSSELFVVGRHDAPHAVRVSLMSVADPERLRSALHVLAEILEEPPEPGPCVV